MRKFISSFSFFKIQYERAYDHLYRTMFGLPRISKSAVTPYIFVGGQYSDAGAEKLESVGVTGVVNMREGYLPFNAKKYTFSVLHLPTKDQHAPTLTALTKGVHFIDKHILANNKVYIHCHWGEGRGPTMAAAYLIWKEKLTPDDAIKLIKKVRTFISITRSQREALEEFADKL